MMYPYGVGRNAASSRTSLFGIGRSSIVVQLIVQGVRFTRQLQDSVQFMRASAAGVDFTRGTASAVRFARQTTATVRFARDQVTNAVQFVRQLVRGK